MSRLLPAQKPRHLELRLIVSYMDLPDCQEEFFLQFMTLLPGGLLERVEGWTAVLYPASDVVFWLTTSPDDNRTPGPHSLVGF